MKSALVSVASLVALLGCATEVPAHLQPSAVDHIVAQQARQLDRAVAVYKEAQTHGPAIRAGYAGLEEGMTESQVDAAFQRAPYAQKQTICGQSAAGPVVCRIRTYDGVIDGDRFEVQVTFRKAADQWKVIGWQ